MSRMKIPTVIERMDAAERIGNTAKALEAGTFGKAQIESKPETRTVRDEMREALELCLSRIKMNGFRQKKVRDDYICFIRELLVKESSCK